MGWPDHTTTTEHRTALPRPPLSGCVPRPCVLLVLVYLAAQVPRPAVGPNSTWTKGNLAKEADRVAQSSWARNLG